MKRFAFAALLLASTTTFAQPGTPAGGASVSEVARTIGRNMGTLPVIQDACGGYTVKQKDDFKAGLTKMAGQMAAGQAPEFGDHYLKGFQEGGELMKHQIASIAPDRLAGLCKEFNSKYPEIVANLNKKSAK
jgi:hypothetical protein